MRAIIGRVSLGVGATCLLLAGVAWGHAKGAHQAHKPARAQVVKISVTQAGFEPRSIVVKKGVPITLVITRKTDQTCATQAVFPAINKTVELPLGRAVRVALPAQLAGHLSYACGMDMIRGELVVK